MKPEVTTAPAGNCMEHEVDCSGEITPVLLMITQHESAEILTGAFEDAGLPFVPIDHSDYQDLHVILFLPSRCNNVKIN